MRALYRSALESVRVAASLAAVDPQEWNALAVPTDATDPAQVKALFAATREAFGRLDLPLANGGVYSNGLASVRL